MAWYQKGLTKKEKAYCDLLVAQGLLQITSLEKNNMEAKDALKIIGDALELTASGANVLLNKGEIND